MATRKFTSVDEYIAAQPEASRGILEQVRAAIRGAVPEAEEVISYNIPGYKIAAVPVLYFAGWRKHYSLYPATAVLVQAFAKELGAYEVEKSTLKLPWNTPAPVELIGRVAKFRAKE